MIMTENELISYHKVSDKSMKEKGVCVCVCVCVREHLPIHDLQRYSQF